MQTNADTPLARHVRSEHGGNTNSLTFWGISKIKLEVRQGNLDKLILQEEAKWIYRLNSLSLCGLNEGFSYTAFI